ncbi:hypothetical protein [Rhizobium halophytocola]|uniref:Uncharacterized protein n=1 Tax=Rhizobium halophytocola TaxID=735519 RepID=A0ABS4E0R6_9HYPH|nr:hypothetical protein [Rhizobium halophytocola]MBP1851532.1 hypothetical protein [Rhizobium halophytocola]
MSCAKASLPAPVLDRLFDILQSDGQLGSHTDMPHAACRETAGILDYLFDAAEIDRVAGPASVSDTTHDRLPATHADLVRVPWGEAYRAGYRQFFHAAGPQIL